jgi:methylated-DNA-[protein]-cysteine S-methyltransferase
LKDMGHWTWTEGLLADGLPMRLYLAEQDGKLWSAGFSDEVHPRTEEEFEWRLGKDFPWQRADRSGALRDAVAQVNEYFAGKRLSFDLPLVFRGTPFQVRVWEELTRIPFGGKLSYGDIAEAVGQPTAFRAVGNANGRNNLPLFVPCHRVLAAGGKLGGYTGGLGLKSRLLAHEFSVLGFALAPEAGRAALA